MRLVTDLSGVRHEVEVLRTSPAATLADLVREASGVQLRPEKVLWVDQSRHVAGDTLEKVGLLEGATISQHRIADEQPTRDWTALLSGGLHAGTVARIPTSRPLVVGRSPNADIMLTSPSSSWSHFSLEREGEGVRVRDTGSTNGTLVNGVPVEADGTLVTTDALVVAGGNAIQLTHDLGEQLAPRAGTLHNVTPGGTAPFNRPPRRGRLPAPTKTEPPTKKDIPAANRFSFITILAPLVLAAAMVAMMGDLRYGAIAALSPILGVGTWLEQKQRRKRDLAEEEERYAGAVAEFGTALEKVADVERARRRDEVPDPTTVLRRAALPTTRLWERRPTSDGFLTLHAGTGDVPWEPPTDAQALTRATAEVKALVEDFTVPAAPVEVDLSQAGVVGVVGEREGCLAVARSLVLQAATHCGPADLTIVAACDPGREEAWSWATWLPHTRILGDASGDRWVSAERGRSEGLLRVLRDGVEVLPTPQVLLVLDTDILTEGREAPARALLGHGRPLPGAGLSTKVGTQVSGVVVASSVEQLPAACTTVITVGADAAGTVARPLDREVVEDVVLAGIDLDTARRGALNLARYDDPELVVPGAGLPSLVTLPPLLGLDAMTPEAITRLWSSSHGVSTPIGVGEGGTYSLDIVRDGPHGLVGGTTGSGKSEFLRSLVAGLAARNSPEKLTFILIDFKGGAAFKTCERLPHTIGTISNLDAQLADRAIRALEAEMNHRQQMFAAAGEGVDNLDAYLATNPAEPMPRLLLVIDEFAMLAKDYPDVLKSLVSVGAVGRTLGVHMVLATQRPAGVVNDDILANTNLRVALRVQSREDSTNVIDVPHASAISRDQRGRAYVKLGQDDITPVQTALVTGRVQEGQAASLELRPVVFGRPPAPAGPPPSSSDETDLDVLIDAIIAANEAAGYAAPRRVWPEALAERVDLAGFPVTRGEVPVPVAGGVRGTQVFFGLSDEPDRQRQVNAGWDLSRGNILLAGIPGSGTSTTLATLALSMARTWSPEELDLFVLDMASRDLADLEGLPHTVSYVGPGSGARERQVRLFNHLRAELERRRTTPGPHRRTVLLLDGLAALRDEYQDYEGQAILDSFYRTYAEGPELNLWVAVTTTRVKSIPSAVDEVTTQKWLFRLADLYDYSTAGLRAKDAPAHVAGRAVGAETKLQTHVATSGSSLEDAVGLVRRTWPDAPRKRSVVRALPDRVTVDELEQGEGLGEPWRIPVGLRGSDLATAFLELYEGEHALVAGPARSGKSTVLLGLVDSLRQVRTPDGKAPQVYGLCQRRSPLAQAAVDKVAVGTDQAAALVASVRLARGPIVLLVDDAEQFEDTDASLAGLLGANLPNLHIVAAGRSDDLRGLYSHWTKTLRKSRAGVLLQPNVDYDGELCGVMLPRKSLVPLTVGRGYLCQSGSATLVQSAAPTD
ncbi:MAG TPA: FHA domain-containing protein [Propionibacterium sp.]|nr:FHA domain-containing protein [Propionibacterium sp.]